MSESFFSVSYDLIIRDKELPYGLFVNSSSRDNKQRFVKIYPEGQLLTEEDLADFKKKYHQLYIPESQRSNYMQSLVRSEQFSEVEVSNVIKDTAITHLHKVFDNEKEFTTEILEETIEGCKEAVENMIDVLDGKDIKGLTKLIASLSEHDFYTYDHSINVSMYCISILRALRPKASRAELMHAGLGGLLHDLGKIKIPTNILNSPQGLSEDEYQVIKTHPDLGMELLKSEEFQVEGVDLNTIGRVIHEHHEQWDGGGYPTGKKEKEIHVLARICTIADFFDAITTKRSYSKVLTITQGIEIMEKHVGGKLDPLIFKVFKEVLAVTKISEDGGKFKLAESFDPSIPYANLPLEEIKELFKGEDFGKIKMIEDIQKKKKK